MKTTILRPTKQDSRLARSSYDALEAAISRLKTDQAEIEIEETGEKIVLPLKALKLLKDVLKAMSKGEPFSLVPVATEVTTQRAAEILGCSRPFLVKLLEEGEIPFTKVGRHRRIQFEDVMEYKQKMKEEQKRLLIDMMHDDEELGSTSIPNDVPNEITNKTKQIEFNYQKRSFTKKND